MCSSTVTPVVPGCTRWNLAENGTGRTSVLVRRIGGGNSLELLRARLCSCGLKSGSGGSVPIEVDAFSSAKRLAYQEK